MPISLSANKFIYCDAAPLRKKAEQLHRSAAQIGANSDDFGMAALGVTHDALVGIYGPELGQPDRWQIGWRDASEGSTLGLLTVRSEDPFVIGYEFGTPPHQIWARRNPGRPDNARPAPGGPRNDGAVLLDFFWERAGIQFNGPMVNHPGARAHQRRPYLMAFLREIAKYGWSSAVRAAILDRPYEPSIPIGIPRIFTPNNDDNMGR